MKLKWVYSTPHPALNTHKWVKSKTTTYDEDGFKDIKIDYKCSQCGVTALNDGSDSFIMAFGEKDFKYSDYLNFTCGEIIMGKVLT